MSLPKKITPDNIKDSIIEVRYKYSLPYEVVLGLMLKEVINTNKYKYVSSNSGNNIPQFVSKNYLFYNDNIKFQISPISININCFKDYIGWDKYFNEIKNVLDFLSSLDRNISIDRIGLRYVSEYIDEDLSEKLNFTFSFGQSNIKSNKYLFNSEFTYKESSVILAIRNLMPNNNNIKLSHIDIDVSKRNISENIKDNNFKILFEYLDEIHTHEKEIFFKLLKEDYINILNPKY